MSRMTQKKAIKKKQREKESKKKVLERRANMRAPKIEENQFRKKMDRITKLQKEMGELKVWGDDVMMKLDDKTLNQLENNARILKALEAEYEAQRANKSQLNSDLEGKGLLTLQEKLGFLHQELVEQQKAAGTAVLSEELGQTVNVTDTGITGAAECRITPNIPPKEVAEVTVIKAPGFEAS